MEYRGLPWSSYCRRTGAWKASTSSGDIGSSPAAARWSCLICVSTEEACGPPITEMRAFGHIHRKRGE